MARVTVRVVSEFGEPLAGAVVDAFIDEKGHNHAALFRKGQEARNVPYGRYRIRIHADDYLPFSSEVEVGSPNVPITVGLEWPGVENHRVTATLSGKLAGFPGSWGEWWCKASGLYLKLDYESPVNLDDMRFDFGEVPAGIYLLTCVADQKFVVVRTIRTAADTAPFRIDYKPDEDGEAVKH